MTPAPVTLTWADRRERAALSDGFCNEDVYAAKDWHMCLVGERLGYPATEQEAVRIQSRDLATRNRLYRAQLGFNGAVASNDFDAFDRIYAAVNAVDISQLGIDCVAPSIIASIDEGVLA